MRSFRIFLLLLSVLLLGYAFLDKGFAYFGFSPLYVGEIVLAAGVSALLLGGFTFSILRSPIITAILLFIAWGAITTWPSLLPYGLEALRNSVIWSYSVFALIVATALLRTGTIEQPLDWYGRWLPWFLLWAPISFVISQSYSQALPLVPGSNISVLSLKGGDLAVHLTGIAAFLALGLYRRFPLKMTDSISFKEYACWFLVALGILITGSRVRAGLVTFLGSMALLMIFRPMNRATKFVLPALLVVFMLTATNISLPVTGERSISIEQIYRNIDSIISPDPRGYLVNTRNWRIEWWLSIVDYTVLGDYFWTGKGYGVNLAIDDNFYTGDPNRSPHNATMTILARSGVPGAILWLVVQGVVFLVLVKRYFAARRAGYHVLGDVNLWLLIYWFAFLVNSSFDVYLEGPQGGIWYWCVVGYIIAITLWQDSVLNSRTAATAAQPAGGGFDAAQGEPVVRRQ